jgi:hypothetical protein
VSLSAKHLAPLTTILGEVAAWAVMYPHMWTEARELAELVRLGGLPAVRANQLKIHEFLRRVDAMRMKGFTTSLPDELEELLQGSAM